MTASPRPLARGKCFRRRRCTARPVRLRHGSIATECCELYVTRVCPLSRAFLTGRFRPQYLFSVSEPSPWGSCIQRAVHR